MKHLKRICLVILFGVLGVLGFIFWPRIRECCDRWLADQNDKGASSAEES